MTNKCVNQSWNENFLFRCMCRVNVKCRKRNPNDFLFQSRIAVLQILFFFLSWLRYSWQWKIEFSYLRIQFLVTNDGGSPFFVHLVVGLQLIKLCSRRNGSVNIHTKPRKQQQKIQQRRKKKQNLKSNNRKGKMNSLSFENNLHDTCMGKEFWKIFNWFYIFRWKCVDDVKKQWKSCWRGTIPIIHTIQFYK